MLRSLSLFRNLNEIIESGEMFKKSRKWTFEFNEQNSRKMKYSFQKRKMCLN